jgi:hypothetical protein
MEDTMDQKTTLQMLKTVGTVVGIGCVPTISLTFLGAIIAPLVFIASLVSSPAYQNAAPGREGVLFIGSLPFFLAGAVGGAILGVVISGVIALIIWLRSKKTAQDKANTEIK